jgi:hypothetical protein
MYVIHAKKKDHKSAWCTIKHKEKEGYARKRDKYNNPRTHRRQGKGEVLQLESPPADWPENLAFRRRPAYDIGPAAYVAASAATCDYGLGCGCQEFVMSANWLGVVAGLAVNAVAEASVD